MGRACKVLLEFRELCHAIAVFLKGRELLIGPTSATCWLISTTGNIRVLDTLEELEVSKGRLVATEERISAKMCNNGSQAFDC